MPIDAHPDHVAIAVPDHGPALAFWRDELGGGVVSRYHHPGRFKGVQLRYDGGAKLELLMPSPQGSPDGFLERFLTRFGARVHHVTLKVPDLLAAVTALERDGFDVADVDTSHATWHEAFLRPSQVGGIVVQIAWSGTTDEEWAARIGVIPEPPRRGAPRLLGPHLVVPDLDEAVRVWSCLGATVDRDGDGLTVGWDGAPLTVRVERAERADALGLRFDGTAPRPADPEVGPAILQPQ